MSVSPWIERSAPGIAQLRAAAPGPEDDASVASHNRSRALQVQSIKNDIADALVRTGIGPQAAVQVLDALCSGQVPHVSVDYVYLRPPWKA